jgi:hypothetical protein
MRFVILFSVAALISAGCNRNSSSASKSSPTSTPQSLTVQDLVLTEADLAGCKLDRQGESVIRVLSQSFNCGPGATPDPRVTEIVSFTDNTVQDAERNIGNMWSTMDAARDYIRKVVLARPVIPESLEISNAKDRFGTIGADQEYVYCATFSDGVTRAVEYFGAFRHRNLRVEWSAFQTNGDCTSPSRAQDLGKMAAAQQIGKLKSRLPAGFITVPTITPTVVPNR